MNLDGLAMSVHTRQMKDALQGGQLQKLYQIDKTTIVAKVHSLTGKQDLVITVGNSPSMYLSNPLPDLPKEPTSLIMFLRKHVEGSRITDIEQINGDRIFRISLDKLELNGDIKTTYVYVELMGKYSNCIFVQDGSILESLVHVTPLMNRERSIAPKLTYELPPNANRGSLLEYSQEEIGQLLISFHQDTMGNTIRGIFNGFGKAHFEEVLHRLAATSQDDVSTYTEADWTRVASTLYAMGQEIEKANTLYVYKDAKGKDLLSVIPLSQGTLDTAYDNISLAISQSIQEDGAIHTSDRELEKLIKQAIKKEELRHKKIQDELQDTEKRETYKLYGDLLMINGHLQVRYEPSITVDNVLADPVEPIAIKLNPELSIIENGQWYYKLYNKLKNRIISGQYQLDKSSQKLEYLQSILYSLSLSTDRESLQEIKNECMDAGLIKKSKKPLSYKISKENFITVHIPEGTVYIGRNNRQNDYLTHRFAKPDDMWFHTKGIQGSHVILRTDQEMDDDLLSKVAQYAAYYSKGQDSPRVEVDYTLVRNIKKPPGSPPGFVIFNTNQTMYVEPVKPESVTE
ncbi:MAG: fibronectin-binding domain-containing protein [Veillonella sp.]|nr:fibronectin-binding domain-containing protein [Veillonella sp.]